MTKTFFHSVLTLLCAFTLVNAHSQNLDTVKIDHSLSVLNNRAFFNFPTYAANISRGADLMSADPNANVETRIVLDIGKMRLVFFAQELYTLGSEDLVNTIRNQNEKTAINTRILMDKDSLFSILSTPTQFDSTKSAILVNSLIVRTQDNTLFRINAFINPVGLPFKDQFIKLTENVFNTLTKGTRVNNRNARQEKLNIFGTDKSFLFNIPANYCITIDQKYDFQVFKFHKYQNYGESDWIQLIVYNGYYPSDVYRDYGLSERDGKKIDGHFLNKKINWLYFEINQEGVFDKEQKITCNNIEKRLIVHVAMLSNNRQLIEELTKIAESIQLVDN